MSTGTAGAGTVRREERSSFRRARRSAAAALGLLVVIGASAVGLHDVAEAHLAAPQTSTHA